MTTEEIKADISLYGKDIYSFCCYLTKNKIEAEDLYQDVFLKALEKNDRRIYDEEIKALAEGAELTEADEEVAYEWFDRYETADDSYVEPTMTLEEVISVGDTVVMPYFEQVEVTVNNLTIQDDFAGITTDCIGYDRDYSPYISEDGTVQATLQYVKSGDGIDELDQIVEEKTVTCKLVVMNLTVKNTSETDEAIVCICPRIVKAEDGQIYYLPIEDDGINIWPKDDLYCIDGEMLSFSTEHAHSKNNLVDFLPGETTDVQVAFILDENQLDNAYIQLMNGYLEEQPYLSLANVYPPSIR